MAATEKKPIASDEEIKRELDEGPRPMREVFLIRNLARDPSSRTARKLRPGNYTGFILGDGRRIRRAGARGTELSFKDVYENRELILEGIKNKEIEVSLNGEVGTHAMMESFIEAFERHGGVKRELTLEDKKRIEKESGLGDDNPSQLPTAGADAATLRAKVEAEHQAKLAKQAAEEEAQVQKAKDEEDARLKAALASPAATPPTMTVMLTSVGEDKIKVIREVREITGLDLGDVKALVESLPKPVASGLTLSDAAVLMDGLKKAGATAELVESTTPVQTTPATPPPPPVEDDVLLPEPKTEKPATPEPPKKSSSPGKKR